MNYWETLLVGLLGAIIGAVSASLFGWFQEVRLARHRFACALFRLEHTLNHRKSENIYDTFTDAMVFEIWDLGMAYVTLFPIWFRRGIKIKIGFLLGLIGVIEGDRSKHPLSHRSLPAVPDAFKYIDELVTILGYKK